MEKFKPRQFLQSGWGEGKNPRSELEKEIDLSSSWNCMGEPLAGRDDGWAFHTLLVGSRWCGELSG